MSVSRKRVSAPNGGVYLGPNPQTHLLSASILAAGICNRPGLYLSPGCTPVLPAEGAPTSRVLQLCKALALKQSAGQESRAHTKVRAMVTDEEERMEPLNSKYLLHDPTVLLIAQSILGDVAPSSCS